MDIAALQAFLAVAETGSFSRAGERIFLTQPAVSKRIATLENQLGARLFDRIGKQVRL
ncbi:MAG: LysR family transcriptional regulator, partial [Pseudomonadota bacterium]